MKPSRPQKQQALGKLLGRVEELHEEGNETIAQLEALVDEAKLLHGSSLGLRSNPKIYVIDADREFRATIRSILINAGFEVRTCSTASEFLTKRTTDATGCMVLDLNLPGVDGLELQNLLSRQPNPLPIIFVSAKGDIPTVVRVMKAGACDFLLKPVAEEVLIDAVNRALAFAGRQQYERERMFELQAAFKTLSRREVEVLELVVAGKMNKEIAADLGVAMSTVKAHRARVRVKMHANSLAELVHIANWIAASSSIGKLPG